MNIFFTTDFLFCLKSVPVQQFTKGIEESKFSDHLKVKERKQSKKKSGLSKQLIKRKDFSWSLELHVGS